MKYYLKFMISLYRSIWKKIVIVVVIMMVVGGPALYANAQKITLSELVELFIALDIIPQDKAEQARAVVAKEEAKEQEFVPLPNGAIPSSEVGFARDLKFGDRGEDVRRLQKRLNTNAITQIAFSGPGSPSNETDYFGELTRLAVIRFQEMHFKDILLPVGIVRGTGFVGLSTRARLNNYTFVNNNPIDANAQKQKEKIPQKEETQFRQDQLSSSNLSLFSIETDRLIIAYPLLYEVLPGDSVLLFGFGFEDSGNVVHFGDNVITEVFTFADTQLSFTVPDVAPGRYRIFVSNAKGESNTITVQVVVPGATPPVVDFISPKTGIGLAYVTFHGSNFVPKENTVYTGYGIIENVPSPDGKTLTVQILLPREQGKVPDEFKSVPFDAQMAKEKGLTYDMSKPNVPTELFMYVQNENGFSNGVSYKYYYDVKKIFPGLF